MKFHDKCAKIAIEKNISSTEFKKAAEVHAKGSWFLLIIFLIVWYFVNIYWAIIPGIVFLYAVAKSISSTMIQSRVEKYENEQILKPIVGFSEKRTKEIIESYGEALQKSKGVIADTSKLPYPKKTIKKAIILSLLQTDDDVSKNALQCAYLFLANWQDGVGPEDINLDLGIDEKNLKPENVEELVAKTAKKAGAVSKWQLISSVEMEKLKADLLKVESIRNKFKIDTIK